MVLYVCNLYVNVRGLGGAYVCPSTMSREHKKLSVSLLNPTLPYSLRQGFELFLKITASINKS